MIKTDDFTDDHEYDFEIIQDMIEKQDSRDNSELILTLADPKRRHNDFYVVQYDMKDVGECGLCFACMPPRSIQIDGAISQPPVRPRRKCSRS